MQQPDPFDVCTLDRLVDGELSTDERRRLLAALEEQPGAWRQCALAFLESQSLRTCLPAATSEAAQPTTRVVSRNVSRPVVSRTTDRRRASMRTAASWLSVAAAVLVAAWLGRYFGSPRQPHDLDAQLAGAPSVQDAAAGSEQPAAALGSDADDVVTMLVRDVDGVTRRVRLPLIEAGEQGPQPGGPAIWTPPQALVQQLREGGLDLRTRRRYAPVFFERPDGIVPMVVPVDDGYVTPAVQHIY